MIESGTVLQGRFLIEKELARGGMGAVYLATDQKFGSRVAIKERFYEDAQLAEAFAREARILNSLHHPILPHVSDHFSEGGGQFLVMEYIEGDDLSEILKREGKAFPVTDVVRWMLELLDGLDFLHSQDPPIVHRDIKPGNLKLTPRGNLVLLDFGLAKETSGNNQGVKSVFGYSRRYSPLEQIEGAGTGPRSDLFSLGATAYHLITGEAPLDVLARASAIVAGRSDPLRLASDVNAEVDLPVARVIHRALALDQQQRYLSAREMHSALYDALEEESAEQLPPAVSNITNVSAAEPAFMPPPAPVVVADQPQPIAMAQTFSETAAVGSKTAEGPRPRKKLYTGGFPRRRRSALLAAAVMLIGLLAIGFSASRFLSSDRADEPVVDVNEPVAAEPIAAAPAAADEGDLVTDATSDDQVIEPEISQAEPLSEVPAETEAIPNTPEEREKTPVSKRTDRRPRDMTRERDEGKIEPEAANARRRPVEQRIRSARERTARTARPGRSSSESPVSSIEMIFTGIPPERQRRSRRSQPF